MIKVWTKKNLKAQKDKQKLKQREIHLKSKYGLTFELFDKMVKKQKNKCAICFNEFIKIPSVDHDHSTNEVRGLLCNYCNHGLGNFKENIDLLDNAIAYLNHFKKLKLRL